MDKFDFLKGEWLALKPFASDVQHLLTGVDAGHRCGGISF